MRGCPQSRAGRAGPLAPPEPPWPPNPAPLPPSYVLFPGLSLQYPLGATDWVSGAGGLGGWEELGGWTGGHHDHDAPQNPPAGACLGPTIQIGEETVITVDAKAAGQGKVTCKVSTPDGAELDVDVVENHDGTFDIYYTAPEPGKYVITIRFGGEHVPNSPFHVLVGVVGGLWWRWDGGCGGDCGAGRLW